MELKLKYLYSIRMIMKGLEHILLYYDISFFMDFFKKYFLINIYKYYFPIVQQYLSNFAVIFPTVNKILIVIEKINKNIQNITNGHKIC